MRHATEVEFVRRMQNRLQKDILSVSDAVELSRRSLPRPFRTIYWIQEVDMWGLDLDLKVQQRSKGFAHRLAQDQAFRGTASKERARSSGAADILV